MSNKNLLNSVQLKKPKRNRFDLSHDVKLSCQMGQLVPTLAMEVVPGDKVHLGCDSLVRFAPMIAPMMHRVDCFMHYFFVPNRILWENWETYITNSDGFTALPAHPTLTVNDGNYTKLMDYLGIPAPQVSGIDEKISALPFAAYAKIYNEYYRDQNLITELRADLIDGDNTLNTDLMDMQYRCWEHDYFTAALPFAQKGAAVTLPLGTFDDVQVMQNNLPAGNTHWSNSTPGYDTYVGQGTTSNPDVNDQWLFAQTSALTTNAATINDLRRAFRLQEWLEKQARGGSRYIETILNHFGVRSSDKRLQRPEYITGAKSPIVISEVLNTTGTSTAPQGNMAGHGVGVVNGHVGSYFVEEHGFIMGIMSIMPKTAYQQGIHKSFLKYNDPFELYFPSFAHIGEQEIANRELYAFQGPTGNDTFGYIPRYAEYKFMPNRVAGDFRGTLEFWHMGRKFNTPPNLNQAFVQSDPTDRVFAVGGGSDHCYVQIVHKIQAIRPMPVFGTPQF